MQTISQIHPKHSHFGVDSSGFLLCTQSMDAKLPLRADTYRGRDLHGMILSNESIDIGAQAVDDIFAFDNDRGTLTQRLILTDVVEQLACGIDRIRMPNAFQHGEITICVAIGIAVGKIDMMFLHNRV